MKKGQVPNTTTQLLFTGSERWRRQKRQSCYCQSFSAAVKGDVSIFTSALFLDLVSVVESQDISEDIKMILH